ncbi:MAG: glycosyltransferase family 9 protein [Burkholderiaceae bacterium]|nr:glycosyltransferase family 9 protein [Burkholderiaceae bacterium]
MGLFFNPASPEAEATEDFRRIVFIVPAQLGDVFLCTPAIHAARLRWPRARIDVLGFAGTLGLLDGNPDINNLVELRPSNKSNWKTKLGEAWRVWRRYDLALVARTSDRAHLIGWLAGRQRSVLLPDHERGRAWKARAAQHSCEAEGIAVVPGNLALLSPWVKTPLTLSLLPPPPLPLPAPLEAQLRSPCVVVHVPSMWRYKQWPVAHFRCVIETLLADGVQVVLTGSASENDQALVAAMLGVGTEPDLIDVAGRLQLRQLRALLEHADAYLGPDTSITHLAAAVQVPIVTLFGPSWPDYFGPWPHEHSPTNPWRRRGQRQQVGNMIMLQGPDRLDRPQCVPCNRMGCEHRSDSASHCLENLGPERVLIELRRLLRDAEAERLSSVN